jgi:hypothetical protein
MYILDDVPTHSLMCMKCCLENELLGREIAWRELRSSHGGEKVSNSHMTNENAYTSDSLECLAPSMTCAPEMHIVASEARDQPLDSYSTLLSSPGLRVRTNQ